MRLLLDKAVQLFRDAGIREVYPAFDAVPLPAKSDRLFTVLGLESVQLDAPFPDRKGGVHPFSAAIRVSVLVPMDVPACRAEDFFYETVIPVMDRMGAVIGESNPAVVDLKLQKIVMSGLFRVRGLYLEETEVGE